MTNSLRFVFKTPMMRYQSCLKPVRSPCIPRQWLCRRPATTIPGWCSTPTPRIQTAKCCNESELQLLVQQIHDRMQANPIAASALLGPDILSKLDAKLVSSGFTGNCDEAPVVLVGDLQTVDQKTSWVLQVLRETGFGNHFDRLERFVEAAITGGTSHIVHGVPQGGKTDIFPVVHLCGVATGRPVVLQVHIPLATLKQTVAKYSKMLDVINAAPQ